MNPLTHRPDLVALRRSVTRRLAGVAGRTREVGLDLARDRRVRWGMAGGLLVGAAMLLAGAAFYTVVAHRVAPELDRLAAVGSEAPSRLYARPVALRPGEEIDADAVAAHLAVGLGYRALPPDAAPPSRGGGWFALDREAGTLTVASRRSPMSADAPSGSRIAVGFTDGVIDELRSDGQAVDEALLEPLELHAWLGSRRIDRRPIKLSRLPEEVVLPVLAAEDHGFFEHGGLSWSGIARAMWVNWRRGRVEQGASTITQQLAKNLFLGSERTWRRKVREAIVAVELDRRFTKQEVLQAYLDEVYWGRRGTAEIVGLGAAARHYFGKDAEDLDLTEAATLAAMIPAPARFDPAVDPEECRRRRDAVLRRLGELGWVDGERIAAAAARPVEILPPAAAGLAPHFVDAVAVEAAQRYGVDELAGASLRIFSTLDVFDQLAAEAAVAESLPELEKGGEWASGVEAALVSVDPASGEVLAYVGGRDHRRSQFDRARQARRQVGSLFKPFVFAASIEELGVSPATWVLDEPIEVRFDRETWRPRNNDGEYHGVVSLRRALELSLNTATVRLGAATGLSAVTRRARDLGVPVEEPVPAVLLGSTTATPLQMAAAYGALANGGRWAQPRAIRAIRDRAGVELPGAPPEMREAIGPEAAVLVTSMLQGVVDRGTAASARRRGIGARVAGKTGTSNAGRDAWFAAYGADRATVVWVGFDDNRSSRLSGTRAAVPLWTRFALQAGHSSPRTTDLSPELLEDWIDPTTGERAGPYCPVRVRDLAAARSSGISCRLHREPGSLVALASREAWEAGDARLRPLLAGLGESPRDALERSLHAGQDPRWSRDDDVRGWSDDRPGLEPGGLVRIVQETRSAAAGSPSTGVVSGLDASARPSLAFRASGAWREAQAAAAAEPEQAREPVAIDVLRLDADLRPSWPDGAGVDARLRDAERSSERSAPAEAGLRPRR